MRKLFLLVSLVLAAGQAHAEFMNGQKLMESCSAPEDSFLYGVCWSYVLGVQDAHHDLAATNLLLRPLYCEDANVTAGQRRLIVKKYLQENPEKLHFSAGGLVISAFIEAFPCE